MSLSLRINNLKANPETASVGNKWTTKEEEQLLNYLKDGKSIDDIAIEHKRTSGSINSRIKYIAARMVEHENKDINDVSNMLNISIEDIQCKINYNKQRNLNKVKNADNSKINEKETDIEILRSIREILLRIEAKLL